MRPARSIFLVSLLLAAWLGSCAQYPLKRLSVTEARACAAKDGHESRSAFGAPICLIRYSDAGRVCKGKTDCLGRCLNESAAFWDAVPKDLNPIGMAAPGQCEAADYTPGCYFEVEGGKISTPGICVD